MRVDVTMLGKLSSFVDEESGAVTADWVVLTAAITGLGLVTVMAVEVGLADLSPRIAAAGEDGLANK